MNQRDSILKGERVHKIVNECLEIIKPNSLEAHHGLSMRYNYDDGYLLRGTKVTSIIFKPTNGLDTILNIREGSIYDVLIALAFNEGYEYISIPGDGREINGAQLTVYLSCDEQKYFNSKKINYLDLILAWEKKNHKLLSQ
jgi:hypothetical protein